jgi:hypothetical protein
MADKLTDFNLPTNAYTAFDALSLKSLIKDRLNNKSFFTDQNYEGSNLSSMIDIVAYSYHVLLFYLNQTSNESTFTEAELYENINRIVKTIDYKPTGQQTANLSFNATGNSSLGIGTYTIPRFSFLNAGGIFYSTKEDITFSKTEAGTEVLTELQNNNLLYQLQYQEYPVITATGEEFEQAFLAPGDDLIVDHFSINVFVRDIYTNKWSEFNQVQNLFLERSTSNVFEARLNENKRYEIRFGNNATGKKLNVGDEIAIYYLKSDGVGGETGIGAIDGNSLTKYTTSQFLNIFDNIKQQDITYITPADLGNVIVTNTTSSTNYYEGETVEDIKERAPSVFSSQYRLVNQEDYANHILQNYSNIIKDVKVVNNADYIGQHLDYNIKTLKLAKANDEPRTIYNQNLFADACDFNNVYVYCVPQGGELNSTTVRRNYVSPALKTSIINSINEKKILTTETVLVDPVYVACTLGIVKSDETADISLADTTKLRLVRSPDSRLSVEQIKNKAENIIRSAFNGLGLGSTIEITDITTQLIAIDGVADVKTCKTDGSYEVNGVSMFVYNPIYPNADISFSSADINLPFFKYPYLQDATNIKDKIEVVAQLTSTTSTASIY